MAKSYAFALAGGLLATFTVSPALSALLLPEVVEEKETAVVLTLRSVFAPVLRFAVPNRILTLGLALVLLLSAGLAARMLGVEFLPKLEEGKLWIRPTLPSSYSLESGNEQVNRIRTTIGSYPEVETVVSQQGRPDDGTDATGFFNAEFFVPLLPADLWPKGTNKDDLTKAMAEKLASTFPGVEFNFSQ